MSITTIDSNSSELQPRQGLQVQQFADTNKHKILKAFNQIKTHASAVANFTLQWQDLEDHFLFINNSIQSKLQELEEQGSQNAQFLPTQQSQHIEVETQGQANPKRTQLSPTVVSQSKSIETPLKNEETLPEKLNFNEIPLNDGKALLVYLNEHLKEHESMREKLHNALKASEDSGKLVLEAMDGFRLGLKTGGIDLEVSVTRRSCVLLLEELIKVKPFMKPQVIEEALKLALIWKANIKVEMWNSIENWGFLLLLGAYSLVGEFDSDEILKIVGSVVQRKQALELFRSLGFTDKASDFIQHLISEKKHLEAVRFIYAFELVDKFPPVPLLKSHLNYVKKAARIPLKKGKSSLRVQNDATNKEIASLRSVIRCIEEYRLESEYSPENLRARIDRLRNLINEKKVNPTAPGPQAQVQQPSGKKRMASKAQLNNQKKSSKQPRIAPPAAAQHVSARSAMSVPSLQPSYHRPVNLFEGQGAEYLSDSGIVAASSAPSTFVAASKFYSLNASHNQPASSFTDEGHGPQYSSRHYSFSRSIPDAHMNGFAGSYGLLGSPPVTQHTGLTAEAYGLHRNSITGHYSLGGSDPIASHMNSSTEQYGTSIAADGRSGQAISSAASPRSNVAYYLGDQLRKSNDRLVSSRSGYNTASKRPASIYHI
ncbi:hypothetical protein FNV43_RR04827 [Rhamnella rubrinervis]|uniref:FRIGIDA-like protein n=1 Tax=Rhamnella rubrinervis TaxID=2594499 RepID=A0A8K0HMJ9_9ROSA|nr:hypothetical protein FNV43_RR04827 [Rhamnella rubrinervis]